MTILTEQHRTAQNSTAQRNNCALIQFNRLFFSHPSKVPPSSFGGWFFGETTIVNDAFYYSFM